MAGTRSESLSRIVSGNSTGSDALFSDTASGTAGSPRIPVEPIQWSGGDSAGGVDDPGYITRVKLPEEPQTKKADKGRSRTTASERQAEEIADGLQEKVVQFFGLLTTALPVTGVYGVERSDKAVNALMNIGKRNPKIMKWLGKAADGVDAIALGEFAVGLSIAIQVDMKRLSGEEMVAQIFGVTSIMEEHFWDEAPAGFNPGVTVQAPQYAAV